MKKTILLLFAMLMFFPIVGMSQNIETLWQEYEVASKKDLPKTQMTVLEKIVTVAANKKEYGHLAKAQLLYSSLMTQLAPDSLIPEVKRLEATELKARNTDNVLAAIYEVALGKVYESCYQLPDHTARSKEYYDMAMSHPEDLFKTKQKPYLPLIDKGEDKAVFGETMLNVIAYETGGWKKASETFSRHGNRRGACLAALHSLEQEMQHTYSRDSRQVVAGKMDSLMAVYSDLEEAALVAVVRYKYFNERYDKTADKVAYIDNVLNRWGHYNITNYLRNDRNDLTRPGYRMRFDGEIAYQGDSLRVELYDVRNVKKVYVDVLRLKAKGSDRLKLNDDDELKKVLRLVDGAPVIHLEEDFSAQKEWEESSLRKIKLQGLPNGIYLIKAYTDDSRIDVEYDLLYVSQLFVFNEELPNKTVRYIAVDTKTGQPKAGVKLRLREYEDGEVAHEATVVTDASGEALYTYTKEDKLDMVYASADGDTGLPERELRSTFYGHDARETTDIESMIFTDRSIYRPGQEVHASAVFYQSNDRRLTSKTMGGVKVKFTLVDANYQTVVTKEAITDDYGVAAADLTIPSGGLTGRYTVKAVGQRDECSRSISVEEYKRPTFYVEFEKYKDKYKNGDTIRVKGIAKSYAGMPVQNAKVAYTVNRRQCLWWSNGRSGQLLLSDTIATDDEGAFYVTMPMCLPEDEDDDDYYYARFYDIIANANVTDMAGETRTGSISLPVSNKEKALSISFPNEIEQSKKMSPLVILLRNAAGEPVDGKVAYSIDDGPMTDAKPNTDIILPHIASGKHKITAVCDGDTVTHKFTLFSLDDPRPFEDTDDWFYVSEEKFPDDGRPVYVQLGSSAENVKVYYSLVADNKVIETGTFDISNSMYKREFNYKEEYVDGLSVGYAWVKDGKLYHHTIILERPMPDKSLKMEWVTFRDKLTPGQKETWKLKVANPDNSPSSANIITTIYDKSLDQLVGHNLTGRVTFTNNVYSVNWCETRFYSLSLSAQYYQKDLEVKLMEYTKFDADIINFMGPDMYEYDVMRGGAVRRMAMNSAGGRSLSFEKKAETEEYYALESAVASYDEEPVVVGYGIAPKRAAEGGDEPADANAASVSVRENFNETAAFLTNVYTDSKGVAELTFTLPESVTTWKVISLAHDRDMNIGRLTGEAVAKKVVMVQPNMPRFLRMGDDARITTRLFNSSEKPVSGTAEMQIIDPETNKVVVTQKVPFSVAANSTASATFPLDMTETSQLYNKMSTVMICKIVATGKGFSDGEQHFLPILPEKEMVTNTLPFTMINTQTFEADLQKLFDVDSPDNKLTIEFTENPAWLMVQALPSIGDVNDNCAICNMAAYYANTIASQMMNLSPKIGQTVSKWASEKGGEGSLTSHLNKNQELKEIVVNETPWVMDASSEEAQKALLIDYFNTSKLNAKLNNSIKTLRDLQNSDGSWSWWKGMKGNEYVTMCLIQTLTRLKTMTGGRLSIEKEYERGFDYMDKVIARRVKIMKELEKKGEKPSLYGTEIDYLYSISLSGRKCDSDARKNNAYLLKVLMDEGVQRDIRRKAIVATILFGATEKQYDKVDVDSMQQVAREYVQSMKEWTVYKEDMGRYYDTHRASYSWCDYKIPTQVAVIEAMKRITPEDSVTITEMQRWILQQKRTQQWDTPINSVNAVYAFLMPGGHTDPLRLGRESQPVTRFILDGRQLDMGDATEGLGYVKKAEQGSGMKTMRIEKGDNSDISWGALYAQFMQKQTEIKDQSAGLKVKREFFVLTTDKQMTDKTVSELKVGDRVLVRITIEAERDYDFVQVDDKRAACMEPQNQLSGYRRGYYTAPKDNATSYFFDRMAKGIHVIESEYFIDKAGTYQTGVCTAQCAYSPEYHARDGAVLLKVK
ncbi:MAG: alpha-2-macroglobulin [Prevotella sp.]|nr:alpha-2-macroglobulin [Prevotella sp.]